jgi:hypothetical protein
MSIRLLASAMILAVMFAIPAAAQQDPLDQGVADSLLFVISQPQVGPATQTVVAQLYIFHDVQRVLGMGAGFSWDSPKLVMDSVVWSPAATTAFNLIRLEYFRSDIDSTNLYRRFQAVGAAMFGSGIATSASPQLIASYYFHATDWTASDKFCIALETFVKVSFVDPSQVEYRPIWGGPYCVGFIPTGVLQVSPSTLNFSGVAGGSNPVSQNFNVTEQAGQNIAFTATEGIDWITLTNPSGTTPGAVGVNVNIASLAAGDYNGLVTVSSAAATNEATVTVNLHLDQPNRPPVLNSIGDRSTDENQLLQFTVTASDPDGTTPALTTSALPTGASFDDHGDGTGTFRWTPTFDQAGSYPITFTASDGSLTDTEDITITVNNVNRPPALVAIGPRQVLEGVNLSFGLSGSDPDMTALAFSALDLPSGATLTDHGNATATFDWTPSNTQSGFYDVTFIVSDGSLADSELVNIEVIDADGFTLSPNPLTFMAWFGDPSLDPQVFHVSISDGSNVAFEVSSTATWFTLGQAGGTTPADIEVTVNLAGLAAGHYRDSIQVFEAVPTESAAALDPVWEYVELTIRNYMSVDPTSLSWTVSEGELSPAGQSFMVRESGGDAMAYSATTSAPWLILENASGTTPHSVGVSINISAVDPGTYDGTVVVTSSAVNSPLEVSVHLEVTPCQVLTPATVVYNRTAFQDESLVFDETVSLSSSGPLGINWVSELPQGSPYTLDPASGYVGLTPSEIALHYEKTFSETGDFSDTALITAVQTGSVYCASQTMIITNVTVNRPPSADTVIVVNTPAVPGMRVAVPVVFTNSCRLTGLGLSLNWTGGMYLDSVSFVGSAIAYVDDKMASINNDLGDVTITMDVGEQMMVPFGSQQLLATLWFALPCEIEAGTYGFGLGSYPPLTPADVYFYRDCGEGTETEFPEYIPGAIVVGTASNYVCGYVVDPFDNEIEGATVELWDDYPLTEPLMSTLSSSIGGFAFDEIMVIPFDLYAYKEGYYPGKVEDINFGDKGIKIVLQPLPEIVTPTSEWVDYFCPETDEGVNLFLGVPVPVGAVVEAYTQDGLLVGQTMVHERGKYGFMPVYRANDEFGDPGARTGDHIHFTINAMDAVATGNTTYPPDYTQIEVCLEVRGTVEKVCTLFEGWNLISWNVNTDSDNILNVLAPVMDYIDVVLGFERGGLTFDPDLPIFSTLWNVDHLSGYWVRIQGISQIDLTITGLPVVESTPIPLAAGWNLVSFLPEESWPVETALANVDHFTLFAYGFPDGEIEVWQPGGQFNQLESFDPCNGYWIKTTQSGTLIYNGMEPSPKDMRPQIDNYALGSENSFATTSWVNLYSRDLILNGEQVTAGSTVRAHAVNGDQPVGSFTLTTSGQFGFMPVYADAAGENTGSLKPGDQFYLVVNDVKTDEVFTWTNNGDRIEVTQLSAAGSTHEVLPSGYSLEQNYPNPFNPSTVVRFSMPVTARAKIEVFNVLGASVAVIFNGLAQAGEHEVVWDGRDDSGTPSASGVYFYRLTADNYTETRKMMLMK